MAEVVNFTPIGKNASLKEQISFTFRGMLNADGTTAIDKPQFEQLTDKAIKASYKAGNNTIYYFNATPNNPNPEVFTTATQTQVTAEVQSVGTHRTAVRAVLSNYLSIKYSVDDNFKQFKAFNDQQAYENANREITRATNGDILDIDEEMRDDISQSTSPNGVQLFTGFIESNSDINTTVTAIEENYVELESTTYMQPGNVLSFVIPQNMPIEAQQVGFTDSNRVVSMFQIEKIEGKKVYFKAGEFGFFSEEEKEQFASMIVLIGAPVYWRPLIHNYLSLQQRVTVIESSIPLTNIYRAQSPDVVSVGNVGNLKKESVTVSMREGDKEVNLIEKGIAAPGVGVTYTLITKTKHEEESGDVNVVIDLKGTSANLPVSAHAFRGTKVLRTGVNIMTTPVLSKHKNFTYGPGVSKFGSSEIPVPTPKELAITYNTEDNPVTTDGEYYFNFQANRKKLVDDSANLTATYIDREDDILLVFPGLDDADNSKPYQIVESTLGLGILLPLPSADHESFLAIQEEAGKSIIFKISNISATNTLKVNLPSRLTDDAPITYTDVELLANETKQYKYNYTSKQWEETTEEPILTKEQVVETFNLPGNGTIRIADKITVSFKQGDIVKSHEAKIEYIDPTQNTLVLDEQFPFDIPRGASINIPQGLLNPYKTYRVRVVATDLKE